MWSYERTEHFSGSIAVRYVMGAESGKNLADCFIHFMQPRPGEAHCLPLVTLKHLKRFIELKDGIQAMINAATSAASAMTVSVLGSSYKEAGTQVKVANLQARIKLVTGQGELFGAMWDKVTQTALRTNGELTATGDLFARIATAGKDAGLSAQQAAEQSLAITETINQSVQLSGASAEASKAAITQLIQGLQAGVLRGDEFNSVMEQSPRLAKALADGLGVTTGQLRGLAEQGQLTSSKVIGALKSQAAAMQQEFGTLPQTVGRSVENLATSWALFVNKLDTTNGASSKVASAIDLLARNLDTVATVALHTGEVVAAMIAVKAIQSAYSYGSALLQAASATTTLATASTQAAGAISAAAAAKARFANIARGVGYAVIADQVLQIALAYKGIRDEQEKQAKTQQHLDATNVKVAQRLREISAATGVTVTSMEELDAAVGQGALVFNQAIGKWQAAAVAQQQLAAGHRRRSSGSALENYLLVDRDSATVGYLCEMGRVPALFRRVALSRSRVG